jgi:SAM-dependent methyltransferase
MVAFMAPEQRAGETMRRRLMQFIASLGAARRGRTLRAATGSDGLPLPPVGLISEVAGTPDTAWFLEGGRRGVQTLDDLLARRGLTLDSCHDILDFGCGCGRVIRHLRGPRPANLHGTDCNRRLVAWCRAHLAFAQFDVNPLRPPCGYQPASFDLIYAFSVFTHLPGDLQVAWMGELRRILRPGGLLVISTHGDHYLPQLAPDEQATYQTGGLVVRNGDKAGRNACAAFHPPREVRDVLVRDFDVLEFVPEGALGNPAQDAWLLRRPGG